MANFAVAGIAYDRFAAVSAYSWKVPPRRRPCSVLWWLIGLLLITALLATPTFMYSEVEVVTLSHTIEQPGFETFVQINKCYEMLPKSIFYWSVFGNVLIGFLLPLTMTAYFILRLVCALYCFTKETEQNRRMLAERRVALWAIVVSLLHFVCCLPHWSFSVYANIAFSGLHTEAAPSQALIQFFGVFRFLSSALSWIPAGLLNDRLEMLEICDGGGDRPNMQQQQSYELAEIRLPLRRTTVFFTYRQHSQTSSYQSAVSFPFTQLNGDTYE
uniref:G-protein coupled receptors family 1 profile domain-containing protein n=1 Tax=Plectus sambesii TaxID=2011161 RepID=A0A914WWY3_9BILA